MLPVFSWAPKLQSWTKVLGHFCFSGAFFNSHRSNPLPLPYKQCWTRVFRIFSEFQLCLGWGGGGGGEGELARKSRERRTLLRGNREMTEKYEYCSTVPRTFVQDCRFNSGFARSFSGSMARKPCGCYWRIL